ncbi:ABC transporter permease subunit [Sinorhizobium medicae]|nr:ABC transporter permease subunit [Sinorhizobium medicae]MDX0901358.1 ABC transporter permease subunit [Sinorhizobium medicae]MDX1176739.1 ABC transporter permease subunit [Sinorhizobium medicae]
MSRFTQLSLGQLASGLLLVLVGLAALIPDFLVGPIETIVTATGFPMSPPSADHWLGTDEVGRDVLNLTVHSARITMLVALLASALSMVLGTAVGVVAGYARGAADMLMMRVADFFLVMPAFLLALVLAPLAIEIGGEQGTVLGLRPTLLVTVIVIGVTSWAGTARIVRSQTLSLRTRPFVDRARVIGASHKRIIFLHILPNLVSLIIANTILTIVAAIWIESALSFIGLGDPFQPSWGTMLFNAQQAGAAGVGAWWYVFTPGLTIVLVVVSLYSLSHSVALGLGSQRRRAA